MKFKIGDLVTRNCYNNDIVFKIVEIYDDMCELKGINVRLIVSSLLSDLKKYEGVDIENEESFLKRIYNVEPLDRNDFFYLPGKVLHVDSDNDYLKRCLDYYKNINIWAMGITMDESQVADNIMELLQKYKPNILVITGHDAYYKRKGDINDINAYKNSKYFADAIKKAREYENSHEKLIIISGGCGSYYEELIRAGANFASSPKRVNIHALDPAIIAGKMSLSDINKDIDLKDILDKTKYGKDGIGGIITKGTMYVGYPR
ncbi:MAG: sporulation peptidase YabG [Bacilli bacterium]|nr:sporulation peptidase YabG [Bacilli bacterium]